MLFGDTGSAVSELEDEAAGRLFKAILRYAEDRQEVALPGEERFVYRMLLSQFARDEESYRKRSEQNQRAYRSSKESAAVSAGQPASASFSDQYKEEEKEKDEDKDKDEEGDGARGSNPSPTPAPAFDPPSPEAVRAYCQEAGLTFDPARFCDYNAARGWMLGNRPMSDWKAAARMWDKRGDLPASSGAPPPRGPRVVGEQAYTQREYTNSLDAFDRMMARYAAELDTAPS